MVGALFSIASDFLDFLVHILECHSQKGIQFIKHNGELFEDFTELIKRYFLVVLQEFADFL